MGGRKRVRACVRLEAQYNTIVSMGHASFDPRVPKDRVASGMKKVLFGRTKWCLRSV